MPVQMQITSLGLFHQLIQPVVVDQVARLTGILEEMTEQLKNRRKGDTVRLEIESAAPDRLVNLLKKLVVHGTMNVLVKRSDR